MRRRFGAEPAVQATELLLQERTPRTVAVARPRVRRRADRPACGTRCRRSCGAFARRTTRRRARTCSPTGGTAVMMTAAGSGYSRWRGST